MSSIGCVQEKNSEDSIPFSATSSSHRAEMLSRKLEMAERKIKHLSEELKKKPPFRSFDTYEVKTIEIKECWCIKCFKFIFSPCSNSETTPQERKRIRRRERVFIDMHATQIRRSPSSDTMVSNPKSSKPLKKKKATSSCFTVGCPSVETMEGKVFKGIPKDWVNPDL